MKNIFINNDKIKYRNETVDPDNEITFSPEFDDLARLN